jgi:hypothetical protein
MKGNDAYILLLETAVDFVEGYSCPHILEPKEGGVKRGFSIVAAGTPSAPSLRFKRLIS